MTILTIMNLVSLFLIYKENIAGGEAIWNRLKLWMRSKYHGVFKSISNMNTCHNKIMIRKCKSYLNSDWEIRRWNEKRFLELPSYVDFIQDEKVKVQWFLSGYPFYKDTITYGESHTLKEYIHKDKCLHEQDKNR